MSLNNEKNKDISVKFDVKSYVKKQAWYLKPVAWLLSFPEVIKRKSKVRKHNMKGLKPPYVLLCTHHAFLDFKVATKAIFPHSASYVVAIDGFIHREKIMRNVGCLCTRKFTSDINLYRQAKYSLEKLKQIFILYPEARYSICGTTAIIPLSVAKFCKKLGHPVVVLNTHGHYINSSVWNLKPKKVPVDADMTQIITKDEIKTLDIEEINKRIIDAMQYDEYKWQLEKGVLVKDKQRAVGLEKVLYKCPKCHAESKMRSEGTKLICSACGKEYVYKENGQMSATDGNTEFEHIPDWYEWERECVKNDILNHNYKIEDDVDVDTLPNSEGFINLGKGHFVHDENGLKVVFNENGEEKTFIKNLSENYSCHIEFDYNNKGDAVSFSKNDETYYFYFENLKNIIVKIHFAVEELYKIKSNEQ